MEILTYLGIIAPIIFLIGVVLGGFLQTGYSHKSQTISELVAKTAQYRPLLMLLFSLYAFMISLFSAELFMMNMSGFGTTALLLSGLLGLVMILFFPADISFENRTATGKIHTLLATVITILTVIAIIGIGFGLQAFNFRFYSIITAGIALLLLALTADSYIKRSNYLGSFQRMMIAVFLQWVFVLAVDTASS
jgi:hypothetical protein